MISKTELAAESAMRSVRYAIERNATAVAYTQVHERLKGMVNFDHDLANTKRYSPEDRLTRLLDSVKDFMTFLENYTEQSQQSAERDLQT